MIDLALMISEQALLYFPLILGSYISFSLLKVPDLSIETAYICGAILSAFSMHYIIHLPWFVALFVIILISMLAGASVGIMSSLLTQYLAIPHLLSTIITTGIFHGIHQLIAGVYVSLSHYPSLVYSSLIPLHPELPVLGILFVMLVLLAAYLFSTQLGYCFVIFGINKSFFTHYDISMSYIFICGVALANALAGLSGYLVAQSNGFADITMGFGKILLCVTALILGSLFQRQTFSVLNPVLGMWLYFIIQQLLLKGGFNLRYFTMVQSIIVLIIMLVRYITHKNKQNDYLGL
jgi:putative ABC transport system permease protein